MRNLTRREVLERAALAAAGASALGAVVLNPRTAWGASKPPAQPRIAVVGAGISGMTAAMTLKDAGFTNVTVYEASDRSAGAPRRARATASARPASGANGAAS